MDSNEARESDLDAASERLLEFFVLLKRWGKEQQQHTSEQDIQSTTMPQTEPVESASAIQGGETASNRGNADV